jgi:hypothetical protein
MKITQKCKRILVIMAAFLMWLCISACSSQKPSEAKTEHQGISEVQSEVPKTEEPTKAVQAAGAEGFESPESAVKAYLEGLKANDYNRMAETFAGECKVDDILHQYAVLCRMELKPDDYISLKKDEDVKQFLMQLTGQMTEVDFGSMKLLGFIPPESLSDIYGSDKHQKNMAKHAEKYGGEKIESCVAAIELGKNKYILIFEVLESEGRWLNLQLGGILANMTGLDRNMAGTMQLDEEDEQVFKRYIADSSKNLLESGKEVSDEKEPIAFIVESEGYDSPLKAAEAYLEGLKANKLNQMLRTFSVESYVDHYDLQAYLESVQAYVFMQQEIKLPVVNEFSRDLNTQSRKKYIIEDILKQNAALYAINGEGIDNSMVTGEDEENISLTLTELPNQLDLSSMRILGYISPDRISQEYGSDGNLAKKVQQAKVYGADKVESSVIVFELKGNRYCFCSDAVEYNGKWYNRQLGGQISTLLGISADFAGIMPIDVLDEPEPEKLIIPIE